MKKNISIEELLQLRLAQAEAEAPPAPRGKRLLELARPWWETWPEKFQACAERLGKMRVAYAHAMTELRHARGGHPVPALIVRDGQETEDFARVVYLAVRDGRLRLRFELSAPADGAKVENFEVTLVADRTSRPVLSAPATVAVDCEYRMDAELPAEIVVGWDALKVTDRMPFRFILRASP
jgi:hypothetical protein